jgi:hypothetical protein
MKGMAAMARNKYATNVKIFLPLKERGNQSGEKS